MIKKILFIPIFTIIIFSNSCNKKHFYQDYVEIPEKIWKQSQVVKFIVNIQDIKQAYNISINVRHGFNYKYKNIWLFIKTTSPSGKSRLDTLNCILQKNNNHWAGKCIGDICDIQIPFADSIHFTEPGKYTFEIEHGLREKKVPLILEIGLIIDKINTPK
jgi:gliding motility-associated lipoprotein GldH